MFGFICGVLVTWYLLGLGYSVWWGENNLYTLLMEIPGGITQAVLEILFYPAILFYRVFLRHTIHPVPFTVLEVQRIVGDSRRVFGNVYFCHDKKAKAFRNKFFFFRTSEKIDNPNKPSVPEGGFRLGNDE